MKCVLRPMKEEDLPTAFAWRNEDKVRETAMSSNPISWNEFSAVFKYNNAIKLIFEVDDTPSGYVSCSVDPDEHVGEWSFHLGPNSRGKGYSEIMLKMALLELKKLGYKTITAAVKPMNLASLYLHKKMKFSPLDNEEGKYRKFSINL